MKLFRRISIPTALILLFTTMLSFTVNPLIDKNFSSQLVNVSIKGTSSLHDWEMKSGKGQVELQLGLGNKDNITGVTSLTFTIPAESLKSGKGTMDKNAYKALKTGTAKTISFVLSSAKVLQLNASTFEIKALGKLSVAGTSHETDLLVNVKFNPNDNSYTATGTKKIKMTDYNVTPPSFMMGAVKTGNEISISFNTKIIQ